MREVRLHVHGMDCAEETALIRRALAPNDAIGGIDFDLINAFVHVTFDDTRTTAAAIADAVRGTGLAAHEIAPAGARQADTGLHTHAHHHPEGEYSTIWTVVSGALLLAGWAVEGFAADNWLETFTGHVHNPRASVCYGLAALAALWPMWPRAVASLRYMRLDMHVLVCLTVIGAAVLGEWSEGAAVAFLFAVAHRMEAWSIERARSEIAALVGRGPSPIAQGVHEAAPVERWIERFAAVYTPLVTGAAVVLAIVPPLIAGEWSVWLYRALVFLVLACPCALVISTPVTMVAALTSAARRGVLVRGGAALERAAGAAAPSREALAAVRVVVADAREGAPGDVDTADVVLAAPAGDRLAFLVHHARRALHVIRQNVAIALLTKVAFLVSAPFGFAPLWMAVLADTGATVIVTLNALRLLRAGD